ncbi:protein-tyrosine phosphatase-like protein [Aspergillus coremiiformis]|uniref:protein-tyrosine-phosphatase n=1 Tax=Aspergillus coremiiformis TaxID=138285 RepID=A0A5N6Z8D2_9EURO|nr:protein-tyrosine phosphatase-like protein [Aspergillus coremiiformis]
MTMNRIPGQNIYVGSILSLNDKAALEKENITHILSVLRLQPQEETKFAGFQHHSIEVDDIYNENLLEHFPSAIKFIQSGLDAGGGVLVHCTMGKSRSATICIAYLLHQQPIALTPQSALSVIRESRPRCEPNDGFMKQLSIYHQMGCPDDVISHPLYNRWIYHREVKESVACGRAPEMSSVLFADEQTPKSQDNQDRITEIKCRKCRRNLATTPFIIPHVPQNNARGLGDCAHIFLHPLTWMRSSLFPDSDENGAPSGDAPLSGRLTCPNTSCGFNIGKFAWQGMQCSCGDWIVPAIGLAKARIDISHRVNVGHGLGRLPPAALGIRLPPSMRASPADDSANGRGNL